MRVYCPKCGSDVELPEKSRTVIGRTISEETPGSYALHLKNKETKQNKKEMEDMNANNFDIETLARMVAAQLNANTTKIDPVHNVPLCKVEKNPVDTSCLKDSGKIDKNHWAENSVFYGKEICGYAYNPYMIRRFLPAQFMKLVKKYNGNVHKGITKEYPYMYSIKFTLEEVRKLAMLERRDRIAFDERKMIFTVDKCRNIFTKYIDDVIKTLNEKMNDFVNYNRVGKEYKDSIKGFGWITIGTVEETIVNHKVVKIMNTTQDFKTIIDHLKNMREALNPIYSKLTYKDIYKIMSVNPLINIPAETKKSKDFMDCFIKAGSYYTLKQQLMFDEDVFFKGHNGRMAVSTLKYYLDDGAKGYQIYAMLKEANKIK